jgi:hypothetical protein
VVVGGWGGIQMRNIATLERTCVAKATVKLTPAAEFATNRAGKEIDTIDGAPVKSTELMPEKLVLVGTSEPGGAVSNAKEIVVPGTFEEPSSLPRTRESDCRKYLPGPHDGSGSLNRKLTPRQELDNEMKSYCAESAGKCVTLSNTVRI